jgi:hypothetical protein
LPAAGALATDRVERVAAGAAATVTADEIAALLVVAAGDATVLAALEHPVTDTASNVIKPASGRTDLRTISPNAWPPADQPATRRQTPAGNG